ncbi:MAG: cupin domain-containing protein [Sneathiella sp.]
MTRTFKTFRDIAIATSVAALLAGAGPSHADENSIKLLSADFASRQVVQVEVGDFHFKPGQVAPIHTHTAPAVGYVAKGEIIYQVEGEKPQILREGDAFFEPTDKRILRFDNASATEEAIFIDFNLQQQGEPFIVFEKKPTEAIDRRSLPTVKIANEMFDRVDVYTNDLAKSGSLLLDTFEPVMGVVAEGIVELRVKGQPPQRIVAGKSFAVPVAGTEAQIVNVSDEIPAKIVTFHLS